jgi:DNA mismatch endonuclease (patch repair protein)
MQAVKSKDTAPEMTVRRMIHRMGYRFRLHRKNLPGKPDLVFPRMHKAIFVHGCFWHGHNCARGARVPQNNQIYWLNKISRNRARDRKNVKDLLATDWKSLIVWECALLNEGRVMAQLRDFLGQAHNTLHSQIVGGR